MKIAPAIQADTENVLPKLLEYLEQGLKICLATLYHADGNSPRPIGSQMAITEDGQWFGYLSGGCAEQAIADEGVKAIRQNQSRSVRYGLGSPYLDIQLPCGASLDIWFELRLSKELITGVLATLGNRQRSGIQFSLNNSQAVLAGATELSEAKANTFRRYYPPWRRLYIIGTGPNVGAIASLAQLADYEVQIFTPDARTLDDLQSQSYVVELMSDHTQLSKLSFDAYSAAVLMFHEHEHETKVLPHLLKSELAYIGALGSQRTHLARIEGLLAQGVSKIQCSRIHGPVGLNIQAKTPAEIAISVLAQMTREFQSKARPLLYFNGSANAN